MTTDDAMTILAKLAELDECEAVWWRCDGEYAPVTFLVNCNDLFYWACADAEPLTVERLPVFEQAYRDCENAGGYHSAELYCCRVRGMRPQQPYYKSLNETEKELFDACGPERDRISEG